MMGILLFALGFVLAPTADAQDKPNVIIQTDIHPADGEPDDKQSLIRFLLEANEFNILGLIATDRSPELNAQSLDRIHEVIDAYKEAYPNLVKHASGYPSADYLRSVATVGNNSNIEAHPDNSNSYHHRTKIMKHPSHSASVKSPVNQSGNRMRRVESTCGKNLSRVCVAGVMVATVLALLVAGPVSAAEVVIHVAPTGDDAGDGSRAKPVASLIGARDVVRRFRAAGKAGPVRVVVADGTYHVAEPLVLRPEDGGSAEAPVRYEAAPGAKPVFSGGRKITGFRPGENGLWVADVPGVAAGQWYFEQLWAGG
ncbi:MAG: DUF1593 domain-containing protein, partial [Planctomycetaceae bacterium]